MFVLHVLSAKFIVSKIRKPKRHSRNARRKAKRSVEMKIVPVYQVQSGIISSTEKTHLTERKTKRSTEIKIVPVYHVESSIISTQKTPLTVL